MEKEIYYTRVLPLVRYIVKKDKNGKEYTDVIDNLSREERLSLSEEKARMLWNNGTDLYVAEQPLSYHEGLSIKFSIVIWWIVKRRTSQILWKNYSITINNKTCG